MGTQGSIVLGSPQWIGIVVAVLVPFVLAAIVLFWRSRLSSGWSLLLLSLKLIAIGLLLFCLLDPLWTRSRAKPGENIVLLVGDNSASMTLRRNRKDEVSRGTWWQERLTDPESDWQTRLAQDFDLRRYAIDRSVTRLDSFQALDFQGSASFLSGSLTSLTQRFQNQPLAAILLFTDGNSTDGWNVDDFPTGVPVFPIVDDDAQTLPDLKIENVSVTQSKFEDAPVTVQATLADEGQPVSAVSITVEPQTPSADEPPQEQTVVHSASQELSGRFLLKPARRGALFYRLKIAPAEGEDLELPEATLVNNERLIAVNRDPHVARVLYVAGRPNWEHKFLGRAVLEDSNLQMVSLIRIARKEARFDFRGRATESSNSLFRGFDKQPDEETEAYDQPVLIRLNTRDANELSDGFPNSKAELYAYDAIILDDIESAFFTRDQLTLMDRFVSERGGGLLMLGGVDSFVSGNWQHTPVADALPVYIDRSDEHPNQALTYDLTKDGWLEPWMRVRGTEAEEDLRLEEMPGFTTLTPTSRAKPGSRVLAEVRDSGTEHWPAIAVQSYGRGRSAALLVGDMWKWSMRQDDAARNDAGQAWRQTVRWLVGDVPRRLECSVEPVLLGNLAAMQLRVRVRDAEFLPVDSAPIVARVTQPDGNSVLLDLEPSLEEAGLFEAVHISRSSGGYLAHVRVNTEDGEVFEEELGWAFDPAADEFRDAGINREALNQLARRTGGEVVAYDQLGRLVADLPMREMSVMEVTSSPVWHRPWLLILVLLFLAGEWGLRRWKGLA